MMISRQAGRAVFVLSCVILSMGLAREVGLREPMVYRASLDFQMASAHKGAKPDLALEKKLLLSEGFLTPVLKDLNLLPQAETARFRSFDLGPQIKNHVANPSQNAVSHFEKKLEVLTYPDNSVISLSYKSADKEEARKIVETLFEKFRDWRKGNLSSGLDGQAMAADNKLIQQREIFLKSQKELLDLVEKGQAQRNSNEVEARRTVLMAELEALKLRYGPKHPAMIEKQKQIAALNNAVVKIVDPAKVKELRDRMDRNFSDMDRAIRESVVLEQKQDTADNVFEILPLDEVQVRSIPTYVFYKTIMAGAAALLLSLLYLKLRFGLRPLVSNRKEAEKFLPYPFIAQIPSLQKNDSEEINLPAAATAEALRGLRQELKLRGNGQGLKLITITSTHEDEGRSEVVASLGRIAARSGERVLILDADLRVPTLQQKLPVKSSRNLVDYLSGQARVEDIINRTDPSGVHIIYGTAVPNTALDLISSEKMKTFLNSLREVYDLVLVQAPPAPKGPDARVLATVSDQTLYLVEIGRTGRFEVKSALDAFRESGIESLSLVLV